MVKKSHAVMINLELPFDKGLESFRWVLTSASEKKLLQSLVVVACSGTFCHWSSDASVVKTDWKVVIKLQHYQAAILRPWVDWTFQLHPVLTVNHLKASAKCKCKCSTRWKVDEESMKGVGEVIHNAWWPRRCSICGKRCWR